MDCEDDADAHGLKVSVEIRPILVIRVPRPDGDAISYAVAGIAEFCDFSHDPGENISSSHISRFFIIFNPEVLIRYCYV